MQVTSSEFERRKRQASHYRRILLLASLNLLGATALTTAAQANDFFDSPAAKACMAAIASQEVDQIEAFLAGNPTDPLVPAMLNSVRPDVLTQIRRGLIVGLPPDQLIRLSDTVRRLLDIDDTVAGTQTQPRPPQPPSKPRTDGY